MQVRVYYEDTDAGGVVYYANYLRWFERGRAEFLRARGLDHAGLEAAGVVFTVSRCDIHYRRPVRLDELVRVETRIAGVSGVSLDLVQAVVGAEGDLRVEATLRMACVSTGTGRPARMPVPVREALGTGAPGPSETSL